jgi:L-alanine-DL-glutamate epimerase-like enolase superfamily enzyme
MDTIPEYPSAAAAIDMALYDLMGKQLGVPVYQLLGGKTWPGARLYPVIPMETPEQMAAMSRQFVGMGAMILKIKLGSSPSEDLARMEAIRSAIGDDVRLRLDVNQGWGDAETAIDVIQQLNGYHIEWVEQPVDAQDIFALAEVTDVADVPIMADESCLGPEDVLEIVSEGAADMINIKLMKCGGLYQATRMLAVAESAGLPCILGSMGESSIASAAGLHFTIAKRGIIACEAIGPLFIDNDPAEGFDVDMGSFLATVSDRPGLGVRLR